MAHYRSIVTNTGLTRLAAIVAQGKQLILTRALVGTGRNSTDAAATTALVSPVTADVATGDMVTAASGENTVIRLPVEVSNLGLTSPLPIREVGIMARDEKGEFLFVYSWLNGPDTDNIIPVSLTDGSADTKHIQDVAVLLTNQEAAVITVEISAGSTVTESRLIEYAATKDHRHAASEIDESTGENVEAAQRRQDIEIAALKEQLDTGFVGTTIIHTFKSNELGYWKGYDGTGYPQGIYDVANVRLYV